MSGCYLRLVNDIDVEISFTLMKLLCKTIIGDFMLDFEYVEDVEHVEIRPRAPDIGFSAYS